MIGARLVLFISWFVLAFPQSSFSQATDNSQRPVEIAAKSDAGDPLALEGKWAGGLVGEGKYVSNGKTYTLIFNVGKARIWVNLDDGIISGKTQFRIKTKETSWWDSIRGPVSGTYDKASGIVNFTIDAKALGAPSFKFRVTATGRYTDGILSGTWKGSHKFSGPWSLRSKGPRPIKPAVYACPSAKLKWVKSLFIMQQGDTAVIATKRGKASLHADSGPTKVGGRISFKIISGGAKFENDATEILVIADKKGRAATEIQAEGPGIIKVQVSDVSGKQEQKLGVLTVVSGLQLYFDKMKVHPVVASASNARGTGSTHFVAATLKSRVMPNLNVGGFFDPVHECGGKNAGLEHLDFVMNIVPTEPTKMAGAFRSIKRFGGRARAAGARTTAYLSPMPDSQEILTSYEQRDKFFPALFLTSSYPGPYPFFVQVLSGQHRYSELTAPLAQRYYFIASLDQPHRYAEWLACAFEPDGVWQSALHAASEKLIAGYSTVQDVLGHFCTMAKKGMSVGLLDLMIEQGEAKALGMFKEMNANWIMNKMGNSRETADEIYEQFKEQYDAAKTAYGDITKVSDLYECLEYEEDRRKCVAMLDDIGSLSGASKELVSVLVKSGSSKRRPTRKTAAPVPTRAAPNEPIARPGSMKTARSTKLPKAPLPRPTGN